MNFNLRKAAKNDFKNDFTKLMNNSVFGKTMENVTTERRRNYLVSKPNYYITKFFTENLLAVEIRKSQILINRPVDLGLSILELSKTVMYYF